MGPLKYASALPAWKSHPVRWGHILHDVIYPINQWPFCDAVSPTGRKYGFGNQKGVAKLTVTSSDHGNLGFLPLQC